MKGIGPYGRDTGDRNKRDAGDRKGRPYGQGGGERADEGIGPYRRGRATVTKGRGQP